MSFGETCLLIDLFYDLVVDILNVHQSLLLKLLLSKTRCDKTRKA